MAKYRILFDKGTCIGSGACTSVCPENWELVEKNGEFKARPKKTEISEDEYPSNAEAAAICPVDAIRIEKVKGKKTPEGSEEEAGVDEAGEEEY